MKIFKKMKKGFTLVELVVVIAVIAILAAVSVGAYFGVTESANNSRLEQEAKQVYTAIQTVSLAPNEHSSLSKDGLVITDEPKFELALEETLGKNVTLLENGDKAPNEPTIYFVRKDVSSEISENVVYSSFEYHVAEINGKKAVADIVTGEVKVETSNVEAGEGSSTTTAPGASSTPTTGNPTTAPSTSDTTQAPLYEDGWHLVTTASEIKDGDQIVIAAKEADVAMSTCQNENNRGTATITKNDDGTIELSNDVQPILVGIDNGKYTFNTSAGYLYAASSSKNYLRSYSEVDDNGRWTIEIGVEGSATIKASGSYTHNTIKYNADQNSGMLFSCYSSGQTDVVIYKNYGEHIEERIPVLTDISFEEDFDASNKYGTITSLNIKKDLPSILLNYDNGYSTEASQDEITWSSSDTNILVITDNQFEIVSYGTKSVTISAKYNNFDKEISFNVDVDVKEVIAGEDQTYTHIFAQKEITSSNSSNVNLSDKFWSFTSDSTYYGWDTNNGRGLQFGSGSAPCKTLEVKSESFKNYTIKQVKINTCGASSINGSFTFTIDDVQIGESIKLETSATVYTFECETICTSNIAFNYTQTSSKAIYIKSITIVYC